MPPILLCRRSCAGPLVDLSERLVMRFFDAGGPRFDLLLDRFQSHQMLGSMASKAGRLLPRSP